MTPPRRSAISPAAKSLSPGGFSARATSFTLLRKSSAQRRDVYGETATFNNPNGLRAAIQLTPKITDTLDKRGTPRSRRSRTPPARIDRLKKLVAGKKLPSVSVQIAEQHINRVVIDPAAQTEMKLILQQIGFEVIEPNDQAKRAEVTITGEAFSELGARKGNLISCRSRVEISVKQITPRSSLLADRQTDVACWTSRKISLAKPRWKNAALKL